MLSLDTLSHTHMSELRVNTSNTPEDSVNLKFIGHIIFFTHIDLKTKRHFFKIFLIRARLLLERPVIYPRRGHSIRYIGFSVTLHKRCKGQRLLTEVILCLDPRHDFSPAGINFESVYVVWFGREFEINTTHALGGVLRESSTPLRGEEILQS